jgi:WD40 repeat protein
VLRGHQGFVTALAFMPDRRRLVSAGAKRVLSAEGWRGEVRAWDTMTQEGKVVLPETQQGHGVFDLALNPDGTRLATAHGDGTVKVWDVKQLLGQ